MITFLITHIFIKLMKIEIILFFQESKSLTQNKISELDIEVFYGYNPFSIFRLCTALIEEKV